MCSIHPFQHFCSSTLLTQLGHSKSPGLAWGWSVDVRLKFLLEVLQYHRLYFQEFDQGVCSATIQCNLHDRMLQTEVLSNPII